MFLWWACDGKAGLFNCNANVPLEKRVAVGMLEFFSSKGAVCFHSFLLLYFQLLHLCIGFPEMEGGGGGKVR